MSYNIDPCDACWQKYQDGDCNINELNDCLVDTTTAFGAFPSNAAMRGTPSGQNWHDCIAKKMAELPYVAEKPRSFCNFQLNMGPRWLQTPHYFPSLLEATSNPDKALKLCYQRCNKDKYSETCKLTCRTDRNAVKNFSSRKGSKPSAPPCQRVESYIRDSKKDAESNSPTFQDEAQANPIPFWIVFAIVALILSVVLVGFFVALTSKKVGQ